jgi:hypothetical protein
MRLLGRHPAPSELVMRAIGFQRRCLAAHRDLGGLFGVDVPGVERIEVARGCVAQGEIGSSGSPAAGSSAVKRAMSKAARTVCSSAAREKSEVLALPRRWPA